MRVVCYCLLLVSLLLVGCARVATTTTMHADGSFTRKVVYTTTNSGSFTGSAKPDRPEDNFKVPAGPDVKVTRTQDEMGRSVTTTRDVAAGATPLKDIVIYTDTGKIGKVLATSSVSVTKLPSGQLEYVETLHAVQTASTTSTFVLPDLRIRVKNVLPAEYQKTELIDRLTREITVGLIHALVGPPEPNLYSFVLTPEASLRRVSALAFAATVQIFKDDIPALTSEQTTAMARSLANILNKDALMAGAPGQHAGTTSESGNALAPLFFCVSFPGKVVETNGITDPVTGEVYWSLLPMALELGDVELKLVVQP